MQPRHDGGGMGLAQVGISFDHHERFISTTPLYLTGPQPKGGAYMPQRNLTERAERILRLLDKLMPIPDKALNDVQDAIDGE
jgi:hypothetical protein